MQSDSNEAGATGAKTSFEAHPRMQPVHTRVARLRRDSLYLFNPLLEHSDSPTTVTIDGKGLLNFGSYSYLGLLGDPRIRDAATQALEQFGSGTHGVRFLAGTTREHLALESTIADMTGSAAAITFSSGYAANLAVLPALLGRHDEVFSDKFNHASIVDGIRLAGARLIRFRHNDFDELDRRLRGSRQSGAKLVVTDGVFSMDGDIADLPRLSQLCRLHGAWLMVDEAHSLGVLGTTGRGIEQHYDLADVVDIRMGSLSKAIPASGGYIAGSEALVEYLRHAGRAYLFSGALPPPVAAAATAALKILRSEPGLVERLQSNAMRWRTGLAQAGFDVMESTTPIVPILCGDDDLAFELAMASARRGVFAPPVVAPAVPDNAARLRTTVTAAHDEVSIDRGLALMAAAGRDVGLLPAN